MPLVSIIQLENGGCLRDGLGLSRQQWVHLTLLERANLVASRFLGSVDYMRTIRQRYTAHRPTDDTYDTMGASNSENLGVHNISADPVAESETLEGMIDFLKAEHLDALNRGKLWDSNAMDSLILNFLEEVRQSSGETSLARCREKTVELFTDLNKTACEQNRWEAADRYKTISNLYGPDEWVYSLLWNHGVSATMAEQILRQRQWCKCKRTVPLARRGVKDFQQQSPVYTLSGFNKW